MIELRNLDVGNWIQFARMQLPSHQDCFVASNVMTIAESKFLPQNIVKGIYRHGVPTGLLAYCDDDELRAGDCWLFRFMIDHPCQGQGIGRAALDLVIEEIRDRGARRLLTMCRPENAVAFDFYTKANFSEAGVLAEGDTLLEMPLNG